MKARPGHVRRNLALRTGQCARCGLCCAIAFRCPHFTGDGCRIHGRHYSQCKAFPIDARDTELIHRLGGECGFRFESGVPSAFPISRHGAGPILATAAVCAVLAAAAAFAVGWYALLFALPPAFIVYFFRDPERYAEDASGNAVLAPADGKVIAVKDAAMPISGRPAVMIDIFLSIFDVHVNRAPLAGRVTAMAHHPGKFLNALRESAGRDNESNVVAIETDGGASVEVKQISGAIARRIVCTVSPGDSLAAGERFGMIRFGSRTQLFMPVDAGFKAAVARGARVRAGSTVLGHMG